MCFTLFSCRFLAVDIGFRALAKIASRMVSYRKKCNCSCHRFALKISFIKSQPNPRKSCNFQTNFNPTYGWKQRKLVQLWAKMESWRCFRFLVSIDGITKIATRFTQLSVSVCIADIDECAVNNGNCGEFADCTNAHGSFHCTCITGFTGNGFTCTGAFP